MRHLGSLRLYESAIREMAVTVLDTLLYVAIFAVTAVGLFGSISLWLALPMVLLIAA